MTKPENESFEKYAKRCLTSTRNTLLPYEDEGTCVSCGQTKWNKKTNFQKYNEKKTLSVDWNMLGKIFVYKYQRK